MELAGEELPDILYAGANPASLIDDGHAPKKNKNCKDKRDGGWLAHIGRAAQYAGTRAARWARFGARISPVVTTIGVGGQVGQSLYCEYAALRGRTS